MDNTNIRIIIEISKFIFEGWGLGAKSFFKENFYISIDSCLFYPFSLDSPFPLLLILLHHHMVKCTAPNKMKRPSPKRMNGIISIVSIISLMSFIISILGIVLIYPYPLPVSSIQIPHLYNALDYT